MPGEAGWGRCPPGSYKRPLAGTHALRENCQVRPGGADAHLAARPHAGTHAPRENCQVRPGRADAHLAARPHAGTNAPREKSQVRQGGADAHLADISIHTRVRMCPVRSAR